MGYQRQKTLGRYGSQLSAPSVTSFTFPASVAGVNASDSLMMMKPEDSIYSFNLMPSEYGMKLRKGYREWATNCVIDSLKNNDLRTIIPFESNSQSLQFNKLFGVTSEGIWDITTEGEKTGTDRLVQFTENQEPSGFGVSCEFTNDANNHYLFYADGLNGIWQYEENGTWSRPPNNAVATDWHTSTGGSNPVLTSFPVEDVVFVMVFKQRIWVILENDSNGYYLPIASITGELKKFTFGAKMPHGGNLQALYNWTLDSGIGVDDIMVAVGRGGDVILYQGNDPEGTWEAKGIYYIGQTPASRKISVAYGPDLYILSTYGLVSLNTLLRGELITGSSPAKKIASLLRADVENGQNSFSWQILVNPSDAFLQIITPKPSSTSYLQYNMHTQTGAWGFWEDVPIVSASPFSGEYYMGGLSGVAYLYGGTLDGEAIIRENLFQNSPNPNPAPAEWTVPNALEFFCNGSQTAETQYGINLLTPLEQGSKYLVEYSIKNSGGIGSSFWNSSAWDGANWDSGLTSGGLHSFSAGSAKMPEPVNGNGTFSFSFIATANNSTVALVGNLDFIGTFYNVTIRKDGFVGNPIKFKNLTSFQTPVGHSNFVKVGMIRTIGLISGTANIEVKAIYDYNILSSANPPKTNSVVSLNNFWDSSVWGFPTAWDTTVRGKTFIDGASGIGQSFAIGIRGESTVTINILGWDVLFNVGGYL